MHRTPYPTAPQFGWIPPQDVARQGLADPLSTSVQPQAEQHDYARLVDSVANPPGDEQPLYWTPFTSELPPTIIKRRCRARRVHLSSRVKYPVMLALAVAAISSSSVAPSLSSSAQAAPADNDTTGSFKAVDPTDGGYDIAGVPVDETTQGVGGPATHTVEVGDTLREIAATFGVDTMALAEANGIADPDLILPGQELTITGSGGQAEDPSITITVEPGDTVAALAAEYGVSTRAIIDFEANELTNPDLILPGQELTIPGGVAPETVTEVAESQVDTEPEPVVETVSEVSDPEPVVEAVSEASNPEPEVEAAPAHNAAGQQIVDVAMSHLGAPYVWGAVGPNAFDCSGFTYYVLNQVVGGVARDMESQAQSGIAVSPDELQPGDVVFQQNTYKSGLSHVGIYIGDGKFINAANPSSGVVVSDLWDSYWGPRFHSARRIQ